MQVMSCLATDKIRNILSNTLGSAVLIKRFAAQGTNLACSGRIAFAVEDVKAFVEDG